MKTWNVVVYPTGHGIELGQVTENSEELARCAALHKFGIPEYEVTDPSRQGIRVEDDFSVFPA